MDVYLVPVGSDRYSLFCEPGEDADPAVDDVAEGDGESPPGWMARLLDRFRVMLALVDYRDRGSDPSGPPASWAARLWDRVLRWLAPRVAEQRLLWRLKKRSRVAAHHPTSLGEAEASRIVRATLQRDLERHRLRTVVYGVAAAVTGPLFFFVPGPNLIAYFFVFLFVSHFLSVRGARYGLQFAEWRYRDCAPLDRLRQAHELTEPARAAVVHDVAEELKLGHLPRFFSQTAARRA